MPAGNWIDWVTLISLSNLGQKRYSKLDPPLWENRITKQKWENRMTKQKRYEKLYPLRENRMTLFIGKWDWTSLLYCLRHRWVEFSMFDWPPTVHESLREILFDLPTILFTTSLCLIIYVWPFPTVHDIPCLSLRTAPRFRSRSAGPLRLLVHAVTYCRTSVPEAKKEEKEEPVLLSCLGPVVLLLLLWLLPTGIPHSERWRGRPLGRKLYATVLWCR